MVIEKLEADMRQTQEEHQNASDGKLRQGKIDACILKQ